MPLDKIVVIALVVAMIVSLFTALWFMITDRGRGTRTVKALTVRVAIWVILLAVLVIGMYTGFITPSRSIRLPDSG